MIEIFGVNIKGLDILLIK